LFEGSVCKYGSNAVAWTHWAVSYGWIWLVSSLHPPQVVGRWFSKLYTKHQCSWNPKQQAA